MSKAEKAVEWSITEDDSENLLRQRQRNDATSNGNAKARERRLKATSVLNYLLFLANLVF